MRSNIKALLAIAMMYESMDSTGTARQFREDEKFSKRKRKIISESDLAIRRGLKKFSYGEQIIWASNQSVADKKAKKLHLI